MPENSKDSGNRALREGLQTCKSPDNVKKPLVRDGVVTLFRGILVPLTPPICNPNVSYVADKVVVWIQESCKPAASCFAMDIVFPKLNVTE